jgi:hypothetical protein
LWVGIGARNVKLNQLGTPNQIIMKMNRLVTLVVATILLNASLAFADDSLFVTLPGETFTPFGNAGSPSAQTVGTAFATKIHACTDNVNFMTDTSFTGVKTVTYTGPTGGITYSASVTFVLGVATNNLTITNAQTTTISVTAAGALTPMASSSLLVKPKLVVTLPGQTFTAGTGNSGTVSSQTAGVPFNITSFTAINADFTIDTAFDSTSIGDQTLSYFGPANAPSGGGTPTYTTTVTFANGVSTTTLATTLVAAQSTTIMASNAVVTPAASSSLTVVAGGAAQIAFSFNTTGGQSGVAWKYQPTVALQDAYGNGPVTNFAQNVTLAIENNPSSGTLSGTTTVAVNINTGVATFSGLSINNVGYGYTLTATGNTLDTSPGTVISALFNIIVLTAYDTAVLNDNPIAYWPMQETSGTTIFDTAGTNTGTMYVANDVQGINDTHVSFDVSNAGFKMGDAGLLNTNVYPADTSIYFNTNFNYGSGEIACGYATNWDTRLYSGEVWLRIPNFPIGYTGDVSGSSNNMGNICVFGPTAGAADSTHSSWDFILWIDHDNNSTNPAAVMGRLDANIGAGTSGFHTVLGLTNSTGATNIYGHNSYYSGQVIHAVQTYDGTTMKYYVNGALVGSTGSTHNRIQDHGSDKWPFVMGSQQQDYFTASTPVGAGGSRSTFYTGGMAHGATYNYALTAQQILIHYLTGIGSNIFKIGTQPVGGTNYVGYTRTLSVVASGPPPLSYQWYKGASPMANQTNSSLVLSNLALTDATNYYVHIADILGATTNSVVVSVGVNPLPSDPYQSSVISGLPQAFYPLHETNGPVANDLIDPVDNNGTYVTYDATNYPILFGTNGASSYLGTAVGFNPLGTNGVFVNNQNVMGIIGQLTLEAWVRVQDTNDEQPIVVHGPAIQGNPSQTADRLEIVTLNNQGYYVFERYQEQGTLNDFGAYYAIPPADPGSWVYLVGVADTTNWDLYENGVLVASTPDTNSPAGALSANGGWAIGARPSYPAAPGVESPIVNAGAPTGITLNGSINNVAIYNYALSPATILQHYQIGVYGPAPTMSIHESGTNVVVSWTSGFLQEAAKVTGSWTYDNTNMVTSPYTVPATNAAKFFRATLTPP